MVFAIAICTFCSHIFIDGKECVDPLTKSDYLVQTTIRRRRRKSKKSLFNRCAIYCGSDVHVSCRCAWENKKKHFYKKVFIYRNDIIYVPWHFSFFFIQKFSVEKFFFSLDTEMDFIFSTRNVWWFHLKHMFTIKFAFIQICGLIFDFHVNGNWYGIINLCSLYWDL